MFDVGLMEIMIILIIALLVIGPERMPEVARKIGGLLGKAKNLASSMKQNSGFNEAVNELQSSLNLEEEKKSFEKIRNDLTEDFSSTTKDLNLDDLQSPFGTNLEQSTLDNQFNKAPSQPKKPQIEPDNSDKYSPVAKTKETVTIKKTAPVAEVKAPIKDSPENTDSPTDKKQA